LWPPMAVVCVGAVDAVEGVVVGKDLWAARAAKAAAAASKRLIKLYVWWFVRVSQEPAQAVHFFSSDSTR
jgi:hypothetical protein